jgi:hypothetical protein
MALSLVAQPFPRLGYSCGNGFDRVNCHAFSRIRFRSLVMDANDQGPGEVQVLTSSRDLDDYDIIATNLLSVAVPSQTTESYRKMIWAAMVTYGLGNSSVDHVMKRYGFMWDKRSDKGFERDPRLIALRDIVGIVAATADELDRLAPAASLGSICSKAALCRLEASFKAAYGLVRKEYIFETDAVVRLILEQLAWVYAVHSLPDTDVLALSPTKCISRLRDVAPDCGQLYGLLSEWAHIDPSIADNYLKFHKAGVQVVRRSAFNSFESGAHLIRLAQVYLQVTQQLFAPLNHERHLTLNSQLEQARKQYNEARSKTT